MKNNLAKLVGAVGFGAVLACTAGCQGTPRVAARPTLDSVPQEHIEREEYLATTEARSTDDAARRPPPDQERTVTWAATAAALVGGWFSSSVNVTVGVAQPFDEVRLLPGATAPTAPPAEPEDAEDVELGEGPAGLLPVGNSVPKETQSLRMRGEDEEEEEE